MVLGADIVLNNVSRLSHEEPADRPRERPLFITCNLSDGYPTAVITKWQFCIKILDWAADA